MQNVSLLFVRKKVYNKETETKWTTTRNKRDNKCSVYGEKYLKKTGC